MQKLIQVLAVSAYLLSPLLADADAGWRGRRGGCSGGSCQSSGNSGQLGCPCGAACACPPGACANGQCPGGVCPTVQPVSMTEQIKAVDAKEATPLEQVNARRRAAGLTPYIECPDLAAGAKACAEYRAAQGIAAHTGNDFAFLPRGCRASAAGCNIAAHGGTAAFQTCAMYEAACTHCGCATARAADGRVFHHLFVR